MFITVEENIINVNNITYIRRTGEFIVIHFVGVEKEVKVTGERAEWLLQQLAKIA